MVSEPPETPSTKRQISLPVIVTAVIFYALGILTIVGLYLVTDDRSEPIVANTDFIDRAVRETFSALTPSPTTTATPVPVEMTFSEEYDYVRGDEDAPITLVEFSDYRCPWCGRFAQETLGQILEQYEGYIRFVYRDYPIFGEKSIQAAHAARCADRQGAFWEYHDLLFESQTQNPPMIVANASLTDLASQLELNTDQFQACLEDETVSDSIVQNYRNAINLLGTAGTPTFLMNGKRFTGALPAPSMSAVLDSELQSLGIEPPSS